MKPYEISIDGNEKSPSPVTIDDSNKASISICKQRMLEAQIFDASITEDEDTDDLEDEIDTRFKLSECETKTDVGDLTEIERMNFSAHDVEHNLDVFEEREMTLNTNMMLTELDDAITKLQLWKIARAKELISEVDNEVNDVGTESPEPDESALNIKRYMILEDFAVNCTHHSPVADNHALKSLQEMLNTPRQTYKPLQDLHRNINDMKKNNELNGEQQQDEENDEEEEALFQKRILDMRFKAIQHEARDGTFNTMFDSQQEVIENGSELRQNVEDLEMQLRDFTSELDNLLGKL